MDIHNKLPGGSMQGLTATGLKELKMKQQIYMRTITDVISRYVPADKQEGLAEEIRKTTQEYYDGMNHSKDAKEMKRILREMGI